MFDIQLSVSGAKSDYDYRFYAGALLMERPNYYKNVKYPLTGTQTIEAEIQDEIGNIGDCSFSLEVTEDA